MDKIEVMKEEAENPMTFNLGTFTTEVGDAIALIDTLNAALANSYSGKGLSVMKEEAENPMTFNLGTFTTEVGDAIALIDTLNAALANSYSGKGLSVSYEVDEETGVVQLTGDIANLQAAYSDLEGYDPSTLFERTANGVHINREALRQLQAQEEALNKSKWLEDEKNLTDQLAVATNKLAN